MTAVGVLLLWAMQPAVVVGGGARCPSPDEVGRRLGEIMAAVTDGTDQDRAVLSEIGGALHIELVRPDGGPISQRDLARVGGCGDLASAAAVVIATWEAQLRPQRLRPVRLRADDERRAAPRSATYDAGASGLASLAGGQSAPGLLVDGTWAPSGSSLGLRAAVAAATTRSSSVAVGTVGYWRSSLAVGPRYRLSNRLVRADLHAALLVGWLHMESNGLTVNRTDSDGELGAEAGIRIGAAWEEIVPWLGFGAQYWPGHDHMIVAINGQPDQHDVPSFDLRLTLGLSLGRF